MADEEIVYIDHGYYREAVAAKAVRHANGHALTAPAAKAMDLPIVQTWEIGQPLWPSYTWDRLKNEGFNANAAFSACVTAYALALPEPPLLVTDSNDDPVGKRHPLQKLLTRPNPYMSHNELLSLVATFLLVGGNAYLHKVRNAAGQTVEIYPYHDGHFKPIPGRDRLIQAYRYDVGDGNYVDVPWEDIIHLKWPVADLDNMVRGMAPLRLLAREVDTDTELTRMVWGLLRKDAMVRTLIVYPQGVNISPDEREQIKARFGVAHSGENFGGVGIATGGATVQRLSLSLQELDLTSLRRIPETRITAVCSIPAMLVGLAAGLERTTYANMEESRKSWTTGTLSRLWSLIAGELEADLAPEFGPELSVAFDMSKVAALQPNLAQLRADAALLYEKGLATKNEARTITFLPPVGDIEVTDGGDVFADGSIPSKEKPTEPEPVQPPMRVIDVTPTPPQLTDEQAEEADEAEQAAKRYPYPLALKARAQASVEQTETAMRAELEDYLQRKYVEAR